MGVLLVFAPRNSPSPHRREVVRGGVMGKMTKEQTFDWLEAHPCEIKKAYSWGIFDNPAWTVVVILGGEMYGGRTLLEAVEKAAAAEGP